MPPRKDPLTLPAQIAELKRERAMRDRVFPKFVESGRLTQDEADYRCACLDGAIASLVTLANDGAER